MAHHHWTKTQKREIYRLAKKGVKYDEIAEKYGVSGGAIAGQVHWYRKELEKEKKSRLRKRLYQKKKLMQETEVDKLISSELKQQDLFLSKRGRPKKSFPSVSGEDNLENLIFTIVVNGPDFRKILLEKNIAESELKKEARIDIEKYKQLSEKISEKADEKDFGKETLSLVRECVFLDKKITKYVSKYDPEMHKKMVERANNARKSKSQNKGGRGKKNIYRWKPEAFGVLPSDITDKTPNYYLAKRYPTFVEKFGPDAYVNVPKLKENLTKSIGGEIGELVKTIDNYEKSLKKAVKLLHHLSEMSWVQRANSKPIIDAAIEELE